MAFNFPFSVQHIHVCRKRPVFTFIARTFIIAKSCQEQSICLNHTHLIRKYIISMPEFFDLQVASLDCIQICMTMSQSTRITLRTNAFTAYKYFGSIKCMVKAYFSPNFIAFFFHETTLSGCYWPYGDDRQERQVLCQLTRLIIRCLCWAK